MLEAASFTDGRYSILQSTGYDIDNIGSTDKLRIMEKIGEFLDMHAEMNNEPSEEELLRCCWVSVVLLAESHPDFSLYGRGDELRSRAPFYIGDFGT